MEALFLLIPLSIVIVFVAIWLFFAMSDSGQFDDMVGPALRILHDDDTLAVPPVPDVTEHSDVFTPTIDILRKK